MPSMNVLLLMQLLREPGRADRKRPVGLTPCDRAALSCAARLKKQNPAVRLTAACVTSPAVCPEETAVSILKNALALGADRGILIKSSAEIPGDGFGQNLLSVIGRQTEMQFSLILTGFHMQPALTEEAAAASGCAWCGNVADLSLPSGGEEPACAALQVRRREQLFPLKKSLPLLAEIVRSDIPPSQPAFLEIAAAGQKTVDRISLDIPSAAGSDISAAPWAFPVYFDAKKTAPAQIASELFSILKMYRLIPCDAAGRSEVFSPSRAGSHKEISAASVGNPLVWADRIVSVGRGAIGPDGSADEAVQLARHLADMLEASVGSSKAAVDLHILPPSCQIGKTSSIVSPDLYVACGISGSIQHQDGMRQSRFIVAVNADPDAPIFRTADIGICGDIREILRALTA